MHKGEGRGGLAALVVGLMILGAFIVAVPSTVLADPEEVVVKQAPMGNYRFDLCLKERLGPENIGSMPIMEIDNTAEVRNYAGPGGNVIIPSIVQFDIEEPLGMGSFDNVVRVSSIAAEAFKGRTDIRSITIPEGVDHIGAGAFSGCTNLTKLLFLGTSMPSNVSDWWLNGTTADLLGYANYCPAISIIGTDFHGLTVFNAGPPSMGGFDMGPPQSPLTGMIADPSGKPLAGVMVAIAGGSNATTDANGRFVLMAPLGLGTFSISGSSIQQTGFKAYLGLGGTEMGDISVDLAGSSSKSSGAEGIALMIVVMAIAVALLVVNMLVARKRMGKD